MQIKKIIKDYTPNSKTLRTPEAQAKVIQDIYDQVREFYSYFSSAEFIQTVKGEKGDPGAEGHRGEKGLKGDKGEQGVIGPRGPRGPKGDTGADGIPGPKGDKGDTGARGEIGPRGPRGPQGIAGAPGVDGKSGEKGDIGAPFGLIDVQNTYSDIVEYSPRFNAGLYLVASKNKENGDVYVYREKYDDFIFLNNIIYDLFFQLMQAPPGKNFIEIIKGVNIDKYGNITIDKKEIIDAKGYLHTKFTLNFLKGNGIASSQWNENQEDNGWSELIITYDNGETNTIKVKNGKQGVQGVPGPQGIQGKKGDKGDKGDTGPQGIPGVDGQNGITPYIDSTTGNWFIGSTDTGIHAKGPQGAKGDQGPQGEKGDKGEQGIQGPIGDKGDKGDKGDSFSYDDMTAAQKQELIQDELPLAMIAMRLAADSRFTKIETTNPEFFNVIVDNDNKIVIGMRHDGTTVGMQLKDAIKFMLTNE